MENWFCINILLTACVCVIRVFNLGMIRLSLEGVINVCVWRMTRMSCSRGWFLFIHPGLGCSACFSIPVCLDKDSGCSSEGVIGHHVLAKYHPGFVGPIYLNCILTYSTASLTASKLLSGSFGWFWGAELRAENYGVPPSVCGRWDAHC